MEQWARNIKRADKELSDNCGVCERHFEERFIERSWQHVIGGEVVHVARDRPSLLTTQYRLCFPMLRSILRRKHRSNAKTEISVSKAHHRPKGNGYLQQATRHQSSWKQTWKMQMREPIKGYQAKQERKTYAAVFACPARAGTGCAFQRIQALFCLAFASLRAMRWTICCCRSRSSSKKPRIIRAKRSAQFSSEERCIWSGLSSCHRRHKICLTQFIHSHCV